jgi:hypothetical protein
MKIGDKFNVSLGMHEVAEATLVEIDGDQAILEIPNTRIIMGIHSSLGDLTPEEGGKERVLLGLQEQPDTPEDIARRELLAAGIELDEEDDFVEGTRSNNTEGQSLKDLDLDGLE